MKASAEWLQLIKNAESKRRTACRTDSPFHFLGIVETPCPIKEIHQKEGPLVGQTVRSIFWVS